MTGAVLGMYGGAVYNFNYSMPRNVVLHLNLDAPITDSVSPSLLSAFEPGQTLPGIVQALDRARNDPNVSGLVSGLGTLSSLDFVH